MSGDEIKFVLQEDECKMFGHEEGCTHSRVVLVCGDTETSTGIHATGASSREDCLSQLGEAVKGHWR